MITCSSVKEIAIEGISVALPKKRLAVSHFNKLFGEDVVTKFSEVTGVQSYHRAIPQQTASDLGYEAAVDLIRRKNISTEDISYLVFVTQKPDFRVPSTAFHLHQRLNLPDGCLCFDLNLACSGFVYGLQVISSLLQQQGQGKALLITGDTSHRTFSPVDRTLIMLFGDSATATLIGCQPTAKDMNFALRTNSKKFKSIITPSGAYRNRNASTDRIAWNDDIMRSDYDTHMKGMDVFGFSITDVPRLLNDFMKHQHNTPDDYDCFALHQANVYILKQIARKLKISMDKIPIALDRFGNNSSNSIPLVLADYYGGQDHGEQRIMMSGFGAGLSWACCDLYIETKAIHPILYTDEYFVPTTNVQ